ncbi:MAG: hypothetical protein IJQ95_08135 [Paludibacteraceae bacterium]|nr:hypothetical protein [Paludibacteraceae bacterium]
MNKHLLFGICLFAIITTLPAEKRTVLPYVTTIPSENHLDYFDLHGPVKEVKEYDYGWHSKTIWRFDEQGHLTEYLNYATPFAGNGGCVFSLTDHYRYAYDKNGKVTVLEAFNDVENLDDANDDKILTLFPVRTPKDTLFKHAQMEFGDTTYCYSRWWNDEDPQKYFGRTYDKHGNMIEEFYEIVGTTHHTDAVVRDITYYDPPRKTSVPVGDLFVLPEGVNQETAFSLDFTYMGYVFDGLLYPLHDGWWIVLSYWCLDQMDGIYIGEDADGEPIPAASVYKNPFAGLHYPVIKTDSVDFMTRNYGGKTMKLYSGPDSKKVWDKLSVECAMEVLDADVTTRRLLCRTNPSNWDFETNPQYYSVYGWLDEEWTCSNLLSTCP